jgi:predicted nucleic acid-binding protein
MGPGRLVAAVADTGPLIHLAEIGCLPLLGTFSELHIPEGVWREADRPESIRQGLAFATRHALQPEEVTAFTEAHGLGKLQSGERESLLLCAKLGVSLLLTDDLAVRKAAKALELTPVGSLGLIARAQWSGRISHDDAERHLRDLQSVSSLFRLLAAEQIQTRVRRYIDQHGWMSPTTRDAGVNTSNLAWPRRIVTTTGEPLPGRGEVWWVR